MIISLFVIMLSCGFNDSPPSLETISLKEMKKIIDAEIPVGSSKDDVILFLKKRDIDFGEETTFELTPRGETNMEWIVVGIPQPSLFYPKRRLSIDFYFDKTSKQFVRYEIRHDHNNIF